MDVEELYDEFGNYIGPERLSSESESDSDSRQPLLDTHGKGAPQQTDPATQRIGGEIAVPQIPTDAPGNEQATDQGSLAIVLPDDKQQYPSAEEVFGPDTEVLIEEEDAQHISEPIVAPDVIPSSALHETPQSVPSARYSRKFLEAAILPNSQLIRNVALVGHLHHGKTSFVDMIFDSTHDMPWAHLDDRDLPVRYTDTRRDEQDLHISIKATASTFLLQTPMEKSYGVTILDTPGHLNFLDESIAAMTLVDGVVVVVDAAEGVMTGTETVIRQAAAMQLDVVVVISKLDRLCLELRLPPQDAYHKIRHIIDSLNEIIAPYNMRKLSPGHGNVAFAACSERVCFTLVQFAREYIKVNGGPDNFPLNATDLARRFWGDMYYDKEARSFTKESPTGSASRTFVTFVLEPFYKLHTAILSNDVDDLAKFFDRNLLLQNRKDKRNICSSRKIKMETLNTDVKTMLKDVNRSVFGMGCMTGFTEMLVSHIKSPLEKAESKPDVFGMRSAVDSSCSSDHREGDWISSIRTCTPGHFAPLAAYVGKLFPDESGDQFDCLVRVLSGEIRKNSEVCVLGDAYDPNTNSEDQATAKVTAIFLPCGRFKIETDVASAGQLVLVQGIHGTIFKSATIVSTDLSSKHKVFPLRPLQSFLPVGVVKVAVEPIKPSELPKMVASLRKCVNTFPGLGSKVEDTGEHTLMGAGELYLDCVLRDLRESHGNVEIKVSDPVVPFSETVSDTSALQCYADTPNKQNKFVMIAEPLEDMILTSLEKGIFASSTTSSSELLREHGWDALAAKSLWTFGPDPVYGPNALLNDILIQDSRKRVHDVRESVVQGFSWAMREGPLAEEPVRAVKLRLLQASLAENSSDRSPAQVIPTCRRVAYSSILTASPRLMEPVYSTEIVCLPDSLSVAYMLVGRRRGSILSESDVAGTPLKRAIAHIPVLDSFGFEADLRNLTHGSAFCMHLFDHWGIVPGDPLDKAIELRPLEPAGRRELARECMIKTRRRKGMPDEVSITKYFDDPLLVELAADDQELRQLL